MSQSPASPAPEKKKNTLGLIALIVAVIGFIFACVPGALIVGWILLPIAFILSIVALFMKGKKWPAVTGLILSVVGTIVGVMVFTATVADAFDEAFDSSGEIEVAEDPGAEEPSEAAPEEEPAAATEGSRENPLALGTTFSNDEWEVTVNSVTLAATDAVLAANQFNDEPDSGYEYILVNLDVTYTGTDSEGGMPAFVSVDYVTPQGNTVDALSKVAVGPDELDRMSTLYTDATASGNIVMHVPSEGAADGVLAINPGMLSDTVFVSVK